MTRTLKRLSIFLFATTLAASLLSCAPMQTWKPGYPDALTNEHYDLATAAIKAKSKHDAQAALFLLRNDVGRMQTNAPDMMAALARLYGVSNAVDREDWDAARSGLLALDDSYGRPAARR